jgi:MoaA/NifB/PqqE/SkfB family radical SAM enzyme
MAIGDSVADIELSQYKVLLLTDRLRALAAGGDTFPVTVELDPVDFCNHRCGWCVDPRHGSTVMDTDCAKTLLAELRDFGVAGIVFKGGGEPLLHPEFELLLATARGHGFEVGIVSNGSRIGPLASALAQHASYLRISVDGPTEASHRELHGTDDFANVVDGVRRLVEARAGRRHPVIGLSFAMDARGEHLVGDAIKLGLSLGVDYVLFRPPFFEEVGRSPTMTPEQARRLREVFDAHQRANREHFAVLVDHWIGDAEAGQTFAGGMAQTASPRRGGWTRPGMNGIEHATGRCWAAPLLAVVTADQKVYPCCNLRAIDRWCIGAIDYAAGLTFARVWGGAGRAEIMQHVRAAACLGHCTHPLSRYNEAIEYLRGPRYHAGFI